MADPILYPIHQGEREAVQAKYANDALMLETLKRIYAAQDSLDADIKSWSQPATGREGVAYVRAHSREGAKRQALRAAQ